MSSRLRIDMGDIKKNLRRFDGRANDAIGRVFTYQEGVSTAFMKTNARWTDDTGNARAGLSAQAFREGNTHTLLLSHAVHYGIWLEVRFSGKYRIIWPALTAGADQIWRSLTQLFRLMEGG